MGWRWKGEGICLVWEMFIGIFEVGMKKYFLEKSKKCNLHSFWKENNR
jgi:hypothetical protein